METPQEYDRRKSAGLDFEPECDSVGCDLRASRRASCAACGFVFMLLCGAHAGRSERVIRQRVKSRSCPECGCEAPTRELVEYAPLWGAS